jgi:hypothetical protein
MAACDDLIGACRDVVCDASLLPKPGKGGDPGQTFCNVAAARVADALGCAELDGLMADKQYAVMAANSSGRWAKTGGAQAAAHALGGGLAFAAASSAMLGEEHGHICVVYASTLRWSASLGKNVPVVANVGKTCGIIRVTQAFPVKLGEPDYFTWA